MALTPVLFVSKHANAVATEYSFANQFSNVQGQNQWYYQQWNGSTYSDMAWDATNSRWQGSCPFCIISQNWIHPDVNVESAIGWKAPMAGTVTVRGTMDDRTHEPTSDGVKTVIKKKSGTTISQVWPASGYQEIPASFMAEHIFTVTVKAGDMLYFHINKNGTTNYDATNWDPTISYTESPAYTVDKAERVMAPADFQKIGETKAQDSSMSIVPNGKSFDFYHSAHGTGTEKFTGTLAQPAQTAVYSKNNFSNAGSFDGNWWISNMYRTSDNALLAFCHIEQADVNTSGWWALGLAYSTDNGNSFKMLGKIVGQQVKDTGNNTNIYGVPYIIKDGYFYIYYGEPSVSVARAPVADVLAAAKNGTTSPWHKYYNGAWDQPGMNGLASTVLPRSDTNDYAVHGDAAYSTYTGSYIMTGYTHHDGKGIWLANTTDGVTFDKPTWLQHSDAASKDSLSPYETIVNVDGTDNGVVGQTFYVYFAYYSKWGDMTTYRNYYRQKVTLHQPDSGKTSYAASGDFGSVQGINQWYYYEYNGVNYNQLTWDAANNRWQGTKPYLIIGPGYQHADTYDSVRAWVAPRSGTVKITSSSNNVSVATGTNADGVKVKITKNGTNLWPANGMQTIKPGTAMTFAGISTTVTKGDTIYFHVNQNVNTNYDTTQWAPVVAYR
jgi:hypothetical protein